VREARLKLALAMCQLVLSDPLPPQLRAPLEIITAFLRELVDSSHPHPWSRVLWAEAPRRSPSTGRPQPALRGHRQHGAGAPSGGGVGQGRWGAGGRVCSALGGDGLFWGCHALSPLGTERSWCRRGGSSPMFDIDGAGYCMYVDAITTSSILDRRPHAGTAMQRLAEHGAAWTCMF
jgi:hypothetical protein